MKKITASLRIFALLCLIIVNTNAFASHVAGGVITYECLGGNQYKVTFKFYRDCTGIQAPNPAQIEIFNSSNVKVQTLSLPRISVVSLPANSPNPCTTPPSGICIEEITYTDNVTLPPIPGGYQLTFDLCCRNPGIVNGPAGSSAYSTWIPDVSKAICNNSAVYNSAPPMFVCAGLPLSYNHAATDSDGDVLTYALCSAIESAVPLNNYPYSSPYTATDPINGGLTINSTTGLITGTPNTLGKFVVGVCVTETRNGVVINTTTRDFQWNVVDCQITTVASALTALTDCKNKGVTFFNNSTGGVNYVWSFGDGQTFTTTSANSFVHNYTSLGSYNVTLISFATNPACNDTLTSVVAVVDTCRPCGMQVAVSTTPADCAVGGCGEIEWTVTCGNCSTITGTNCGGPNTVSGTCGGSVSSSGTCPTVVLCNGIDISKVPGATFTFVPTGNCNGCGITANSSGTTKTVKYCGARPITLGTATVTPTGGTPPYTYAWSPSGGTGATATGLSVGVYTVIVRDINGCVEVQTVNIAGNTLITLAPSKTDVSACGANDGTASVVPSNGTGTYTYLWSPGGQTTSSISGLAPGTYIVTVDDANNCPAVTSITINPAATINVTATITDITCPYNTDGTATASASGGTAPYTYSWNTNPVQTGITATGLSKGFYTVTATDVSGCTGNFSFTIGGPVAMSLTTTKVDPVCFAGTTGTATVSATGGTGTITYLWSTNAANQITPTATGLKADTYTVTATDANGCTASRSVTITQPPAINHDVLNTSTLSCSGTFVGSAKVIVSGGTPMPSPLTPVYQENFSTYVNGDTIGTGVPPSWTSACVTCDNWEVNGSGQFYGKDMEDVPSSPFWKTKCIDISTCSNAELSIDISATVGIGNTDSIKVTYSVDGAPEVVIVAEANVANFATYPAFKTFTGPITNGNCVEIFIRPKGSDANTDEYYFDNVIVSCRPNVYPAYTYSWSCSSSTVDSASGLPPGLCTITTTDNNGCSVQDTVRITNPGVLTVTASSTNTCGGNIDGTATVTPVGGLFPFTYTWNTGATTQSITGLSTGTYTTTVTDIGGCTATASVTVGANPAIVLDTAVTPGCNNTAMIDLIVAGGTSPYVYTWSSGQTTEDISGLASGATYTVTVWDANNCFKTLAAVIPGLGCNPTVVATGGAICSGSCMNITATGGGSAGPYTYAWNPGTLSGASVSVCPTSSTTYTVITTDLAGATVSGIAIVAVTPTPVPAISGNTSVCTGVSTTLTGTGSGTYSWSTGATTTAITVTPLMTTTYTLTATSGSCTGTTSVVVTVNNYPTVTVSGNTICSGSSTPLTATGAITYTWIPTTSLSTGTGSTVTATPSVSTTYTVTGTSTGGCTATTTVIVTVLPSPTANFTIAPGTTVAPNTIVTFTDISTTPSSPSWNFGDPGSGINNTSLLSSPTHEYTTQGNYCITLVATNSSCSDAITKCIIVVEDAVIIFPNVFTPNGDGKNDVFYFYTEGISGLTCSIYDRWGLKMREWTDTDAWEWDGRAPSGKPAPDGVYYYIMEATPANGAEVIKKQGFIQLLKEKQ